MWGLPDLFLIDGGKGQLSAALRTRDKAGLRHLPFIGLAKREEEIVVSLVHSNVNLSQQLTADTHAIVRSSDDFALVLLPSQSDIVKLLQRIRDESHHFAISYHSVLKSKHQTKSLLDDVPGIGPVSRRKLLNTFGSVCGIISVRSEELAHLLGEKQSAILLQYIQAERHSIEYSDGEKLS